MNPEYNKDNFNKLLNKFNEVGEIYSITHPIVKVRGLPKAFPTEIVMFEDGSLGQILYIDNDDVSVLVFSREPLDIESKVARTGDSLKIPVGRNLLGKSVDPMGRPLYRNEVLGEFEDLRYIENRPLGIERRVKIDKPLETGVSVVDMMVPLGKGQRELIIGDRKTGKTIFLLQVLLNQAKKGTVCIYCGIGKKKTDILRVQKFVDDNDISGKTIILATSSTESSGLIYVTPYSAMTLAEYFRDLGENVLIILDDISTHAKFYRELSLIGRNFPGRNSYPGDIFYTHSRLVERAGNFNVNVKDDSKTVAITCLPVAETEEGDISGYIQTNLMSMTDGHIYFDKDLFDEGRRPSVNYFLSVTRVGRQTQSEIRSGINRELSNFLSLYDKTQSFVHFGAELSSGSKATLAMGERVLDFFNQNPNEILPMDLQIMLFCLIWVGIWNDTEITEFREDISKVTKAYKESEELQKKFEGYISSAKTFNELLGKVSSETNKILELLNLTLGSNNERKADR